MANYLHALVTQSGQFCCMITLLSRLSSLNDLAHKETSLRFLVKSYQSVLVAYSGGVDSSLLATICSQELPDTSLSVISDSPSLSREDFEIAKSVAQTMQFSIKIIHTQETSRKSYLENNSNRCYICKADLFSAMENLRKSMGYHYILDGNHAQDDPKQRKGMLAAKDLNILSPLRECNMGKQEVRLLAQKLGLPNWDKPASPCLASRFATGIKIQVNQFQILEKIESICKQAGFPHVRARHHQEIVRLEIPPDQFSSFLQLSSTLIPVLKQFGYQHVTLDLVGLRPEALQ